MKLIFSLLILFSVHPLYAQHINIHVLDSQTRLPIAYATIVYGLQSSSTNQNGIFSFDRNKEVPKVSIKRVGYESYWLDLTTALADTIRVYLKPVSINLSEVTIQAKRNYQRDSIQLRQEYSSIFAYKAPTFKDIWVEKGLRKKSPFPNVVSNSTATIFTIDVLKLVSLIGRNKTSASKLQQVLVKEEEMKYIDQHFSAERVKAITKLSGDSLQNFIQHYRPSSAEIKKMNDYEILMYIRKSHSEFLHSNKD